MVFKIVNFPLRDENFIIPCLPINVSDVRQALMLESRLADSGFCEGEDGDCSQENRPWWLVSKKLVSFQFLLFSVQLIFHLVCHSGTAGFCSRIANRLSVSMLDKPSAYFVLLSIIIQEAH